MREKGFAWSALCVVGLALVAHVALSEIEKQHAPATSAGVSKKAEVTGLFPHAEGKDGLAAVACERAISLESLLCSLQVLRGTYCHGFF